MCAEHKTTSATQQHVIFSKPKKMFEENVSTPNNHISLCVGTLVYVVL